MKEKFTKKDLKNLMVVEQRDGWRGVVVDDRIYSWDGKGNGLDGYNNDLTDCAVSLFYGGKCDIVKVYEAKGKFVDGRANMKEIADFLRDGDTSNFKLVWERKEKKEIKLTTEERAFLNSILLVSDYKYIARDKKCDALWVFKAKPSKGSFSCEWIYNPGDFHGAEITDKTKGMFEFITWDDDEPYLIEDLLKGDIK